LSEEVDHVVRTYFAGFRRGANWVHQSDLYPFGRCCTGVNGKQYAVTALGGTQAGVTSHTVASPFTLTMFRPKVLKLLQALNPITGQLRSVPVNTYKVITRKGVTPAVNQPAKPMVITTTIDLPAGADTYDAANVKAGLALHFGALSQQSAGVGDTVQSAIL